MRMNEEKQQELYNAIHNEVMDLRIEVARLNLSKHATATLDTSLFNIVSSIWSKQKEILNLKEVV